MALIDGSDVIYVEGEPWLLVKADNGLLDTLAAYGAESEDMEEGGDLEPCADGESLCDDEPDFLSHRPPTVIFDSASGMVVSRK